MEDLVDAKNMLVTRNKKKKLWVSTLAYLQYFSGFREHEALAEETDLIQTSEDNR